MNFFKKVFFIFFIATSILYSRDLIESQPEIIFKFENIKKSHENLALQVEFNKAVLHLNRNEYDKAIELFLKTSKILQIPSFLNIGIAYYKKNSIDNAIIYLNKIYENENIAQRDSFSYMSACFYLYKITKDNKYLDTIVRVARKDTNISNHSKRMLADTYVVLKDYEAALEVLNQIDFNVALKKALVNIKLKNHERAAVELNKAKDDTQNPNTLDKILWIEAFNFLKLNRIDSLKETLDLIHKKRLTFKANLELPLELYFSQNKFTSKEYLSSVLEFDENRKYDFLFYFAPFVFSDSQEIIYDSVKGFIYNQNENIVSLDSMLDYNTKFLNLVKDDPIIRVQKLKEILKTDTKSYIYYNLALSYAQIDDFHNAFTYFEKAYKLNPGNKLYLALYLVSADIIGKGIKDKDYLENSMKSSSGLYVYFGKEIYRAFLNKEYSFSNKAENFENTIFYQALDFLESMKEKKKLINHPLLQEYIKDPFTLLIRLVQRKDKESDFEYYARMQDTIPLTLNNYFLEGPLVVTKYYIDILKSLGIFYKADLKIIGSKSPSYLRLKAIRDLHYNLPNETIKTLEYLQKEYELEDKYSMYLIVAALLEAGRYNDASIQISLIKSLLNDKDADFLTAVQLIQDLKIFSAKQFLKEPFKDSLIDFRLVGFDEFLESL